MPDFTPAGATEEFRLTRTERREVVVQEEPTIRGIEDLINGLYVFARPERNGGQYLCFTTGKDCRTVNAGQITYFGPDMTNVFRPTSVDTTAV